MTIRYLIYDLDDTLVNNLLNQKGAFQALLYFLGIPYYEQLFLKWQQFDNDYWGKEIYKTISVPEEYQKDKERYTEYVRNERFSLFFGEKLAYSPFLLNQVYQKGLYSIVVPFDDAYETVSTLALKYPSFIATNGVSEIARYKLKQIQLDDYIKQIFAADMTRHTVTKVRIEFWEELMQVFKIQYPQNI